MKFLKVMIMRLLAPSCERQRREMRATHDRLAANVEDLNRTLVLKAEELKKPRRPNLEIA